jgi:predicted ATPase
LSRQAKNYWMLGLTEKARACAHDALAIARSLTEPGWSILDFTGMLCVFARNFETLDTISTMLVEFATKHDYWFYLRVGRIYRGWCELHNGSIQAGLTLIQDSVLDVRERGARMFEPFWRSLYAEALALSGDVAGSITEIDTVIAFAEENDNTYWNAHLLRQRGELALQTGAPPAEAEAWHLRALALARTQGARMLELRAATALARVWLDQGRSAQAHALLGPLFAGFSDGLDAPDLRDAAALLARPQPQPAAPNPIALRAAGAG